MKATLTARYAWLLGGLLAMAFVLPLARGERMGLVTLHVLSATLIAACVAAIARRRRQVVVSLSLGIPSILMSVLELAGFPEAAGFRDALQTAFAAYTAFVVLGDVVRGERVTAEKIRGAICVYVMIGATFAFAYASLLHIDPGALRFPEEGVAAGDRASRVAEIFYFSFSTFTTVGYGDVLAVHPVARSLAWIEAVTGQIYLAVLVARLV